MNSKIKDKNKKLVVEEYILMVKDSIERIKKENPVIGPKLERYIKNLEDNIKITPYKLGYLYKEK